MHVIRPQSLTPRAQEAHKGSQGSVAIVGGGYGMLGAALLAGRGAMRAGSGKVRLLTHEAHVTQVALAQMELMSADAQTYPDELLNEFDAVAVGMGLGTDAWAEQVFERIALLNQPKVVDADALNLLANQPQSLVRAILTPHAGEAARLLGVSAPDVQADRKAAALAVAERYDSICVLKGAGTLVATPSGEICRNPTGNPVLATAGSGDVLSGIIVSLLAQGVGVLEAAKAGVWLHGRCGDVLAKCAIGVRSRGVLASEIADALPEVMLGCET